MDVPTGNQARVLVALDLEDLRRFTDIERHSGLQATQVSRALKTLIQAQLVLAQTVGDGQYPIKVRYRLSRRGAVVVQALQAYEATLQKAAAAGKVRAKDLPHMVG